MHDYQQLIADECDTIKSLLLKKNADYGNAAFEPIRIFSQADSIEQIRVRIDDKLNRIRNQAEKSISEDTVMDLIGYLVLLRVAEKGVKFEAEEDCDKQPADEKACYHDAAWWDEMTRKYDFYVKHKRDPFETDAWYVEIRYLSNGRRLTNAYWSIDNPDPWFAAYEFVRDNIIQED